MCKIHAPPLGLNFWVHTLSSCFKPGLLELHSTLKCNFLKVHYFFSLKEVVLNQ